jgi:thiamine phosphate synthase YjbQ (UPF0047 family)
MFDHQLYKEPCQRVDNRVHDLQVQDRYLRAKQITSNARVNTSNTHISATQVVTLQSANLQVISHHFVECTWPQVWQCEHRHDREQATSRRQLDIGAMVD